MVVSPERRAVREPGANPGRSRRCEGRRSPAKSHWREPGRRRQREPRVRRPVVRQSRTPRGRRIRVPTLFQPVGSGCCLARARPGGSRLPRARPRRRQDSDDLRLDRADAEREGQRPRRARVGQSRGRVLLPRDGERIRPLRRPDWPLLRRRNERLDLQGQRDRSAGRSRPGDGQGRRHRALVLGDVLGRGRAADAGSRDLDRQRQALLLRERPQRRGPRLTGARCRLHVEQHANQLGDRRGLHTPRALHGTGRKDRREPFADVQRPVRRLAAAGLAVAALAGCGSTQTKGSATLWITRDRGQHVLLVDKVKASYGGRFVQSIKGLAGDRSGRRDWFYFVNGYEADSGAADYTLHSGDVEWWDYRSWKRDIHVPVVVGAFPEPFLHGYAGKTRNAAIVYDSKALEPQARAFGKLIHAKAVTADELGDANVLFLTKADVPLSATSSGAGKPVRFVVGPTAAKRLLTDPKLVRFRYSGLP